MFAVAQRIARLRQGREDRPAPDTPVRGRTPASMQRFGGGTALSAAPARRHQRQPSVLHCCPLACMHEQDIGIATHRHACSNAMQQHRCARRAHVPMCVTSQCVCKGFWRQLCASPSPLALALAKRLPMTPLSVHTCNVAHTQQQKKNPFAPSQPADSKKEAATSPLRRCARHTPVPPRSEQRAHAA